MAMMFDAQNVDPTFMQMVTHALLSIFEAFMRVVRYALDGIEQGLREGLETAHIGGDLQTLIVAIVPILFLALAFKLMGGILRVVAMLVLLLVIGHILAPVAETLIHGRGA
jgi:hypothetical protein